jgi:hypothetical protein
MYFQNENRPSAQAAVSQLREKVVKNLRGGKTIYLERPEPNGDALITHWAHKFVLGKLAEQENIDPTILRLRSNPKGEPSSIASLSANLSHDVDRLALVLGLTTQLPPQHHQARLLMVSRCLGVPITPDDLVQVPQPFKIDGALRSFDAQTVLGEAVDYRRQLKEKYEQIFIVTQSGGKPGKRLSDSQVSEVNRFIRAEFPNPYIIVVSDRWFLRRDVRKTQNEALLKGVELEHSDTYQLKYPVNSQEFMEELRRPYKDGADEIITGPNVNTICSGLTTADHLIATDSFYSWLGSGLIAMRDDRGGVIQDQDAVVLHTMGDPGMWSIPGANVVESEALKIARLRGLIPSNGVIDEFDYFYSDKYLKNTAFSGRPNILWGVQPEDLEAFKRSILNVVQK